MTGVAAFLITLLELFVLFNNLVLFGLINVPLVSS